MYQETATLDLDQSAAQLNDAERQPCEIWTRVMGYHRPVSSFNIGKQGEFEARNHFKEACAKLGR
jgi:anaerobic ribonucleoside-triphosphate reductase